MFFSCSVARLFPSPGIRGQLRVVRQVMSGLTMSAEMRYLDPPMSYLFGSPNKSPKQKTIPNPKKNYIGGSR